MKRFKDILYGVFAGLAQWLFAPLYNYGVRNALMLAAPMTDYSLKTLQSYAVNRPGQAEVIRQRLYDYQVYPTAGAAQFTFFAVPIGQAGTSANATANTGTKNYGDTNMEVAGALPRPKSYLVESIEIFFEPGSVSTAGTWTNISPSIFNAVAAAAVLAQLQDVNVLRITGWLEFYIGSKTYLYEAPLGVFPPKVRLELDGAIASNSATTAEVATVAAKWGGRPYYMDPPITLESMQNFAVYLKFPVAVATPSGFNARIGVVFDGVLFRNSQ